MTLDHTHRHLRGQQAVYVSVSNELLDQMENGWSDPLLVRLERDPHEPYGWRMTFRSIELAYLSDRLADAIDKHFMPEYVADCECDIHKALRRYREVRKQ